MAGRTGVVIGGVDTHGRTHQAAAIVAVGVEGTGSWGAGLCRHLLDEGLRVIEVDRPDRKARRTKGKSDPIDAESAARAVLAGTATTTPKDRRGVVESIRVLRIALSGAVKARTAAVNAFQDDRGDRA